MDRVGKIRFRIFRCQLGRDGYHPRCASLRGMGHVLFRHRSIHRGRSGFAGALRNMGSSFEYLKLGDFTYHVLRDPLAIKAYLMKWILREWEADHYEAPDEEWTVEWMNILPKMEFALEMLGLDSIHPRADLMRVEGF